MRWLAAAVVCGVGCGGLPEVTAEGVHVVVAADPGLVPCGGALEHMDRHVAAVAEEFGVATPTGDDRVLLYWLEVEDFHVRAGCPAPSGGCVHDGVAYSVNMPDSHELVHVLARPLGRMAPYFREGLASAYEGFEVDRGAGGSAIATLESESPWGVNYAMAGAFTRYLVEEFGAADVLAMLRALPWLSLEEEDLDGELRRRFGVTLAEVVAAFEAEYFACEDGVWRPLLGECAAPEIAWDGVEVGEHRVLACEQDDVVGPYVDDLAIVYRTLEIPQAGEYEVTVLMEEGTSLSFTPCATRCARTRGVQAGERRVFELAAGRYAWRVHGRALAPGSVGWSLRRR